MDALWHAYVIGLVVFEADKSNLADPSKRSSYVAPDGAEIFDDKAMRKYNRDAFARECAAKGMILHLKGIEAGKCGCTELEIQL